MLSTAEAVFLGIVQGLTEFLPISSSGHLILFQSFFGLTHLNQLIIFDLICHVGTLLSILVVYKKRIMTLISQERRYLLQIFIATLPLFPALLILKQIESLYNEVSLLGYFFLTTATILYLGIRYGSQKQPSEIKKNAFRDALLIGCSQTVALLPGVSRSGTTLSTARLLGWEKEKALTFSFMLAIPAILGGVCLKVLQIGMSSHSFSSITPFLFPYSVGFTTSFFTGIFALRLLIRLDAKEKLLYFVWYCLSLGILLIFIPYFIL